MPNTIRRAGLILLAIILTGLMLNTGCSGGEQKTNADQQQLHSLLSRYFASWSKSDMAAYKGCFHPLASIYFIDGAGNPYYAKLDHFIAVQAKAQQRARERMSEKPTQISLVVQGRIAHAVVHYELHQGKATVTGTDYFTFTKTDAGWRIITLVFDKDK